MDRESSSQGQTRSSGAKRTRVKIRLYGELTGRIQALVPAFSTPFRKGTRLDVLWTAMLLGLDAVDELGPNPEPSAIRRSLTETRRLHLGRGEK
jgi:hypothetical protein